MLYFLHIPRFETNGGHGFWLVFDFSWLFLYVAFVDVCLQAFVVSVLTCICDIFTNRCKRIPLGVVSPSSILTGKHDSIILICFLSSALTECFGVFSAQRRRSSHYGPSPSHDVRTYANESSASRENVDPNGASRMDRDIRT